MNTAYQSDLITVYQGDALKVLRELPGESVHCCCTSPPYWGLRNYEAEGQYGLEPTPKEHVEVMTDVFREVRRVLRADGTLWLNYGDSYTTGGRGGGAEGSKQKTNVGSLLGPKSRPPPGLKPKDLIGMPWRVAFALQADGWYLRSDIIWHKPNPMPESIQDRPTKAHEYVFLMSKSKKYFYDTEAIREPGKNPADDVRRLANIKDTHKTSQCGHWNQKVRSPAGWKTESGAHGNVHSEGREPEITYNEIPGGRNKRSVWTVPTHPYPSAHFATFPPALIEPCIKAGTSQEGCCAECGRPLERIVENPKIPDQMRNRDDDTKMSYHTRQLGGGQTIQDWRDANPPRTVGWRPSCDHNASAVPCTVLDPFMGSGTTGEMALKLGCRFVGIELNQQYIDELAIPRFEKIEEQGRLF